MEKKQQRHQEGISERLLWVRTLERIIQQIELQIGQLKKIEEDLKKGSDSLEKVKNELKGINIKTLEEDLRIKLERVKQVIEISETFLNTISSMRNTALEELKSLYSPHQIETVLKESFSNLLRAVKEYYRIIESTKLEIQEQLKTIEFEYSIKNISEEIQNLPQDIKQEIERIIENMRKVDKSLKEVQERLPTTRPPTLLQTIIEKRKKIVELKRKSPEIFVGISLLELREYKKRLDNNEIVITPWIEAKIYEIIDHLLIGRAVFLYGETGSGKTEVAKHIAQMINPKGYELIRGYKFMTREDLFGYIGLTATESPQPEIVPKLIEDAFERFKNKNPGLSEEEYEEAKEHIAEVVKGQTSDSATISKFLEGSVYRAMKEGKVLIIDEANYINPGLMASLNAILAKASPGSFFTIPETGEKITIAPGFYIIMTGNITYSEVQRYQERYELDPALRDRVKLIEYNTPPQVYDPEIKITDTGDRDLLLIALATLIDKKGNLVLPNGEASLNKVYRLCQGFKLFQEIFAGKNIGEGYEYVTETGQRIKIQIVKNNLSMRKLLNILRRWKEDGFRYPIDYYLFDEVIVQARDTPQEAKYFYHIFKAIYGFFQDEVWEDTILSGDIGDIVRNKIISNPRESNLLPVNLITLAEVITGESLPVLVESLSSNKVETLEGELRKLLQEYESNRKMLKEYCLIEDSSQLEI